MLSLTAFMMRRETLRASMPALVLAACAPSPSPAPKSAANPAPGLQSAPNKPTPSAKRPATLAMETTRAPVESKSDPAGSPLEAPPGTAPEAAALSDAPAPLPEGTTVLQIGDSFAGALGIDLDRELKAAGVRGVLKYETATYIPTWASSKDLDRYLWQFHPDLVLITLGANELEIPDPEARAPTIRRLIARLGDRPCVWIAPPLWKGARPALLDTIRANCAPCIYLDSSALVPDLARARDHIHPAMAARRDWAKAVFGWLGTHRVPNGVRPWDLKE